MMAINILIIDDDKRYVTRLVRNLRRADAENVLGVIEIDDSIVQLDTVEKLTCTFTGILVSAWIALYLGIPRMTLSTASYPGDPSYFNGSILKREITDTPEIVIQHIVECVETYSADSWLNNQHKLLVKQYQELLRTNDNSPAIPQLEQLLDRFEKILDAQQEAEIKRTLAYEKESKKHLQATEALNKRFEDLAAQLQIYQEELGRD